MYYHVAINNIGVTFNWSLGNGFYKLIERIYEPVYQQITLINGPNSSNAETGIFREK